MLRLAAAVLLASAAVSQAATVFEDPAFSPLPATAGDRGVADSLAWKDTDRSTALDEAFTGTLEFDGVFFFDYVGSAPPPSRLVRSSAVFELPPSLDPAPAGFASTLSAAGAAPIPAPVPLPAAGLLLAAALGAVGVARRR